MDFFLWGYVKERVFGTGVRPTTIAGLKYEIKEGEGFQEIKQDTALFMRVWFCMLFRCQLVIRKKRETYRILHKQACKSGKLTCFNLCNYGLHLFLNV